MGKLDGKVAFITGVARGQGRSHAVRLAQEGADVIGVDICAPIPGVSYGLATPEDLEETVKLVEAEGRRIMASVADVRDFEALQKAFDAGWNDLGPVDIVLANAGIGAGGGITADETWEEVLGVNLKGVWNTGRVAIPAMVERNQGGAIVLTSSTGGLIGTGSNEPGLVAYTASKHGVIGLMRCWANYLAPYMIRVNSVAPTAVRTPMAADISLEELMKFNPALASSLTNPMPVDKVEALDISNAIVWLVSDDARYVTGSVIPVDAGLLNKK